MIFVVNSSIVIFKTFLRIRLVYEYLPVFFFQVLGQEATASNYAKGDLDWMLRKHSS